MDEKYSVKDVAYIVDSEGLGYAIMHYLSADRIEDPKLRRMWEEAGVLLTKIEAYLDVDDEVDDEEEED